MSLSFLGLSACVPNPELDYPMPSQDFGRSEPEPVLRADAAAPIRSDYELDMELDMEPTPDYLAPDANIPPSLHTLGVEFIGEQQTTYNGVEPTVRGHFLWLGSPQQSKSIEHKSNPSTGIGLDKPTKVRLTLKKREMSTEPKRSTRQGFDLSKEER